MQLLHDLLAFIRDPGPFLSVIGIWGMVVVIFIETGLLFPFLPGDSLLVVAGIYAARGSFDLWLLLVALIPAAIAGDAVSYYIGKKTGPKLFSRPRSRFFRPVYAQAAQHFFEKHGGKAIIIARFMPIVRTYVPVIAGVGQMPYRRFAFYNIIGAVSWIVSMTLLGFFLGEVAAAAGFPLDKHLEKVIIVVVFLSVLPGLIAWWRGRAHARKAADDAS